MEKVLQKDTARICMENFSEYMKECITNRDYPKLDGLKESQQAILLSLNDTKAKDKAHQQKSLYVCGIAQKDYHEHGDAGLYQVATNLVGDLEPLVVIGGYDKPKVSSQPPAMRYTSMYLSKLANEYLTGIEVSEMEYNYDGTKLKPKYIMPRFPYQLMKGTFGIAVGWKSVVLPFNAHELLDACKYLVDNPNATTEELMEIIKGPDISNNTTVYLKKQALKTLIEEGYGVVALECGVRVEGDTVIIEDVPWLANVEDFYEQLRRKADPKYENSNQALPFIDTDVKSFIFTGKEGNYIKFKVKKGYDIDEAITELYNKTGLRSKYVIKLNYLVDGDKIELFSIRELLDLSIKANFMYFTKKYNQELEKIDAQMLVARALIKLIGNKEWFNSEKILFRKDKIDQLISRGFTKEEAEVIFKNNNLNRVSDKETLEAELERLEKERQRILYLLSEENIKLETKNYFDYIKTLTSPRRSKVEYVSENFNPKKVKKVRIIDNTPVSVIFTNTGYMQALQYSPDLGMELGKFDIQEGEYVLGKLYTTMDSEIVVITEHYYNKVKVKDIYENPKIHVMKLLGEQEIKGIYNIDGYSKIFITNYGRVKRLHTSELEFSNRSVLGSDFLPGEFIITTLYEDLFDIENNALDILTAMGYYQKFDLSSLGYTKRQSRFNLMLTIKEGDYILDLNISDKNNNNVDVVLADDTTVTFVVDNPYKSPYKNGTLLTTKGVKMFNR